MNLKRRLASLTRQFTTRLVRNSISIPPKSFRMCSSRSWRSTRLSDQKDQQRQFPTAAGVLEEMKGIHPIIELVLNYRELTKLQSTYVDALPQQVNPNTGRVHTTFNQTGTVTGRIASQNPNLQNIPTRTDLGRRVRQGFIAAPGTKLLAVDYSQIELRIVAHIAQDKGHDGMLSTRGWISTLLLPPPSRMCRSSR